MAAKVINVRKNSANNGGSIEFGKVYNVAFSKPMEFKINDGINENLVYKLAEGCSVLVTFMKEMEDKFIVDLLLRPMETPSITRLDRESNEILKSDIVLLKLLDPAETQVMFEKLPRPEKGSEKNEDFDYIFQFPSKNGRGNINIRANRGEFVCLFARDVRHDNHPRNVFGHITSVEDDKVHFFRYMKKDNNFSSRQSYVVNVEDILYINKYQMVLVEPEAQDDSE